MSTAPRASELVRYHCEDISVRGAWTGPAALDLFSHALAPIAELPVLQVLSAKHVVADLTLGLGTVVHDYLSASAAVRRRAASSEILIETNAG
jgi:acetoacetate decarboxylase